MGEIHQDGWKVFKDNNLESFEILNFKEDYLKKELNSFTITLLIKEFQITNLPTRDTDPQNLHILIKQKEAGLLIEGLRSRSLIKRKKI